MIKSQREAKLYNVVLWICAESCQNIEASSATDPYKCDHPKRPQQLPRVTNKTAENTCEIDTSVECDSGRCRSSQTSANTPDLRLTTVPRRDTLSSLVAIFDDHVDDDVTARDWTAAPVDGLEHITTRSSANKSRDTHFRSLCETDVVVSATQQCSLQRHGDKPVNKLVRNHPVDALRDCRLTSYSEHQFPVAKEQRGRDDVTTVDDVTTSDDCVGRRGKLTTNVEHGVSEWSGTESSTVCSDSVTSSDVSKSPPLVLCRRINKATSASFRWSLLA